MYEPLTGQLERSSPLASLAAQAQRLVPAPDRRGTGVSEAAVSQWLKRAREGGPEALEHRPPPGTPRRLSAEQITPLPALLQRGGHSAGIGGFLSSAPCRPLVPSDPLEPSKAGPPARQRD